MSNKALVAQTLIPESEYKKFMIQFDINWKVLRITCSDGSKIWNNNGTMNQFYNINGNGNDITCDVHFSRFIYMTTQEALDYTYKHKTTISTKNCAADLYLEPVKNENDNSCHFIDLKQMYHAFFHRNNNMDTQSFMQYVSYLAITQEGVDSIVTEGYLAFINKNGTPIKDEYNRHYKNFLLNSYCLQNSPGRSDDIYVFDSYYKDNLYMRVVNGSMRKACFIIDPYDSKKCMAVLLNYDGSADYIVGEFADLWNRWWKENNVPRVLTNTEGFIKSFLSKYSNLVLWSIQKPMKDPYNDLVRMEKFQNDAQLFASIIPDAYFKPEGLWSTLVETQGSTWINTNDDKYYSPDF